MWLSGADEGTQDNIHARCPPRRGLSYGTCRLEHHDQPLFPVSGNHTYKLLGVSCSDRILLS